MGGGGNWDAMDENSPCYEVGEAFNIKNSNFFADMSTPGGEGLPPVSTNIGVLL